LQRNRSRDKPSRWQLLQSTVLAPGRSKPYEAAKDRNMPVRLRKLIGTILLVALVIVYALVATMVAVAQLSQSGPLVHLAFFFLTGLLWVLPAMGIIKWMIRMPKPRP
jgi:Protein of unknown function (DUF2842)